MEPNQDVCKEAVFSQVYKAHAKAIYNFVYFKCGDSAQSDDLVQEAFVKLWNNCKKVPLAKAKSFLYTVANNTFLNEVAHKKVVLKYVGEKTPRSNHYSPEFLLEEKQFKERLDSAIANLSEAQRTAFLLNRIEGKKYKEIADILGISVKAVEKRMSQALAAIRAEITTFNK
ncbi:MAG: RNA polymerase sigma factor [Gilvibacter sp.]